MNQIMTAAADSPRVRALGVVFTRRWVAEFVLDLAGYRVSADLGGGRLVEPTCGAGAFLVPAVERLIESCRRHGRAIETMSEAIEAYDIDEETVRSARNHVVRALQEAGVDIESAGGLAASWVRRADFLETAQGSASGGRASWVVGNPPYVRPEQVDPDALARYRSVWRTMTHRADLYVGFVEAGLHLLSDGGTLAFVCADRWMRNTYGARLRALIEEGYSVDACISIHGVDAFDSSVAAYPAVVVIRAGEQRRALVGETDMAFDAAAARRLVGVWDDRVIPDEPRGYRCWWAPGWFRGGGSSWPNGSAATLDRLLELESAHPTLEETGVTVRIGVATGADSVYLVQARGRLERDRLLKVLGATEISSGEIRWSRRWLVNPWTDDELLDLSDYPQTAKYLEGHRKALERRHVARRRPDQWWRTIDRVHPRLATTPKLLVADISGRLAPVLDRGDYYALNSVFYLTVECGDPCAGWDLKVLGGLLLSDTANLFVDSYSVRLSSNYIRLSAQYLRRIRVPWPATIAPEVAERLRTAFDARDTAAATDAADSAYREAARRRGEGG